VAKEKGGDALIFSTDYPILGPHIAHGVIIKISKRIYAEYFHNLKLS